jgi:protein-tyrosine phosphatase
MKFAGKLFRSPQPEYADLERLKARGIRSVVNLRAEANDSQFYCEQLGLVYKSIPLEDWGVPSSEQMDDYLEFLDKAENLPALIHCWAGVGRTGLFVSCYRVHVGMCVEEAIQASHCETPGQSMSPAQQEWIRQFARKLSS